MTEPHSANAAARIGQEKQRDPFFDNARGLLIILVVVGHALLEVDGLLARYGDDIIYAFHMPAFIVITGYLARNFTASDRESRRLITGIIVPYIVFQLIHEALAVWVRGATPTLELFTPRWTLWFLLALVAWRLLVPLFRQLRYPLVFAIAIAVLSPLSDSIGSEFSTGRILQYLPFFIAGTVITPDAIRTFQRNLTRWHRLAGCGLLAATAAVTVVLVRADYLNHSILISRASYNALDMTFLDGATARIVVLILGAAGTIGILLITPQRPSYLDTMGQRSLYIYLLHSLVLWPLRYTNLAPAWLDTFAGNGAVVLGSVALAAALASPPVVWATRGIIEPRLSWLFTQRE
ncbi:acyltransferase family protein [Jonesia quinghaiensis]|uniref:acyltransferase family protein n=1 Tax=Jonesia quinghaiensis TaxID=262806 RepID=UPI00040B3A34|nr:acyltransferase family protein [Jonesia quinghaiensis]